MSAESELRDVSDKLEAANEVFKDALAAWRATHSPSACTRLCFVTDELERLRDEWEERQMAAYNEYFRLQQTLEPETESA